MRIAYNGEKNNRAFKEVFGAVIPALLEADENVIYLDADLMHCINTASYAETHPDRAMNVGIAEANMIGVASGLAAAGFKPIVHSFGTFSTRRCFDQVFLSAGYAKNDISIIGSDPGVCAGFNGGTHMPFEDMALMRSVPSATVLDVCDAAMLESVLKQVPYMPGVKYIRVGRAAHIKVYEDGQDFEIGKAIVLREGSDVCLFASGIMVAEAMKAAEILAGEGIEASVVDMFTVKPLDKVTVVEYIGMTGAGVVCENHNKIGGLYSAICEALAESAPAPLERVAVEDEYGEVGPQDYLQQRFGLTAENIVLKAKLAIARK